MSNALRLTPQDNNYLTSRLLYQQMTQNTILLIAPTNATYTTGNDAPTLILDGSSRAYLTGSLTIGDAPFANEVIAILPPQITADKTYRLPIIRKAESDGLYHDDVAIISSGSGIESVNLISGGVYSSNVTANVDGVGSDATLNVFLGAHQVGAEDGGTGYAVGDQITTAGGTFTTPITVQVVMTSVVSATIHTPGTGGTDGAQIVTGTTGTGTKFSADVTVTAGAITAVNSITVNGAYTVDPSANDPVTGAGLTGAVLTVVLGVNGGSPALSIVNPGSYTDIGVNPFSQASTTGSGTGATININEWTVESVVVTDEGFGYDDTTTIVFVGEGTSAVATVNLAVSATNIYMPNEPSAGDIVYLDGIQFFTNSYN